MVNNPSASAGDIRDKGSVPGLGRSPGVGNDDDLVTKQQTTAASLISVCDGFSTAEWMLLLLLLSRFSHVRLCATPEMAAHQAPPSLGFSRQERWSGLPFPSLMHESEKLKWSRSVVSDSSRPHGLQPTRLLRPWDFPGRVNVTHMHISTLFFF